MLGKLAITSSYGTVCIFLIFFSDLLTGTTKSQFFKVYIFSAELFPTVVRNVGMGTSSLCARIGGIICPYINMLRSDELILEEIITSTCSGLMNNIRK